MPRSTDPLDPYEPGSLLVRAPRALWRRTARHVVVLPPDAATDPICLTGTGVALWEVLGPSASVASVVADLAARFDTDPAVVAADLVPVLRELEVSGVIDVGRA